MGKWLYCWELGSGMGHLRRMATISRGLAERGESVTWCVRRPFHEAARALWPSVIEAPRVGVGAPPPWPASFAELLQGEGWNHAPHLAAWVQCWRSLFEAHAGAHLLADFAPNALLAAVHSGRPMQVVGTGFYCPPDGQPFPLIRHDDSVYADRPAMIEQLILDQCNDLLRRVGRGPLPRLSSLFHQPGTAHHFCTESTLDHYPGRVGARYCGIPSAGGGAPPTWLDSSAHRVRVFAYLKAVPDLARVLDALAGLEAEVLIHGEPAVGKIVTARADQGVRFQAAAVDESALDGHCNLAINHAGHDGSAKLVRAGVPLLQLPLNIEQSLVARRTAAMGAGRWVLPSDWSDLGDHLRQALDGGDAMRAAGKEASRSWVPFESAAERVTSALLERVERPSDVQAS